MGDTNEGAKLAIRVCVVAAMFAIVISIAMIALAFGNTTKDQYVRVLSNAEYQSVYSLENGGKPVPATTVYQVIKSVDVPHTIELNFLSGGGGICLDSIESLKAYFSKKFIVDVEEADDGKFWLRLVEA